MHPSVDSLSVTAVLFFLRLDEFRYTIFSSSSPKEKSLYSHVTRELLAQAMMYLCWWKKSREGETVVAEIRFHFRQRERANERRENLVSFKTSQEKKKKRTGLSQNRKKCQSGQWRRWENAQTCVWQNRLYATVLCSKRSKSAMMARRDSVRWHQVLPFLIFPPPLLLMFTLLAPVPLSLRLVCTFFIT